MSDFRFGLEIGAAAFAILTIAVIVVLSRTTRVILGETFKHPTTTSLIEFRDGKAQVEHPTKP